MQTIPILSIGLSIVIGGILAFRLHAFVALILAGVVVAALTPSVLVARSGQLESIVRSAEFSIDGDDITVNCRVDNPDDYVVAWNGLDGMPLKPLGRLLELETSQTVQVSADASLSYRLESSTGQLPPTGRPVLIRTSDLESAVEMSRQSFMKRLTTALGSYCASLAILIVAASIIGRCLLDSGAADRIVRSALKVVGEKNAPIAFVFSGFTLSIPVFFDTVFYLMVPLGKALRRRTGGNYLLYVLSIVAGGTMAHSLVPPTPGPLFIADAFNVPLFSMIVGGCVVGLFSSCVGMMYAYWINQRYVLELPEDTDQPDNADSENDKDSSTSTDTSEEGPGLAVSLLPVLLPVILIACGALVTSGLGADGKPILNFLGFRVSPQFAEILTTLGEKNLALLISAVIAVLIYVYSRRPDRATFSNAMQDAVSSAGTVILVTAAGGAFGRMMRQTSVAELLEGLQGSSPAMVVIAAFLVTTAVRSAQGSSTVAMLTSAGIFGGLVTSGAAGVDPLYVALAVGCGSKPIAWMNDSGFWVITRMSGMTEQQGLKFVTPMTALAAVAGLVAVIAGVYLLPDISSQFPAA